MKHILVLFSLVVLATACGKSSNAGDNKKVTTITREQIDNLLENQSFECASLEGGRCPGGVARVFILDPLTPSSSGLCTGFLTTTNRLLTNHHCLSTQDECENTYISVYNGDTFETAKCKNIIIARDDGKPLETKAEDFTVIELDHHIRSSDVFIPARSMTPVGASLSAWVIDHLDLFRGRITQLSCFLNNRTPSMELSNCPAIAGNSGSPIVNSRGEVTGVLWGSTTGDNINEATSLARRRSLADFAYATELKYFRTYWR